MAIDSSICTLLGSSALILLSSLLQGSLVLTVSEHNPEMFTLPTKYQVLVYYGDAIYQAGEYKKAEVCLVL